MYSFPIPTVSHVFNILPQVWYSCYNWWTNIDILLLAKIYSLHLEKEVAAHFSILAWRILWTEEPDGLLSIGSHRVGHGWRDLACMHACIGEGNGNPVQYSCLENPRDRGAWWAAVYGVAQSRTRLKRRSSSSSSSMPIFCHFMSPAPRHFWGDGPIISLPYFTTVKLVFTLSNAFI